MLLNSYQVPFLSSIRLIEKKNPVIIISTLLFHKYSTIIAYVFQLKKAPLCRGSEKLLLHFRKPNIKRF